MYTHTHIHIYLYVLSHFSLVRLFATTWIVACQAPPSMEILQARILECVAVPLLGDPPHPGIEPQSLMSPALAGRFFTTSATWEALYVHYIYVKTLHQNGHLKYLCYLLYINHPSKTL